MALSDVQICNLALVRIGETIQVTDITTPEQTNAGIVLKAVYTAMRDEVLEAVNWAFAKRFATLSLVKQADATLTEGWMYDWVYEYAYPSDCLLPRRILDPLGRDGIIRNRIPFAQGGTDANRLIYTDQPSARLEYTAKITSPAFFSATFASALADRVGAEVAPALSRITGRADKLMASYEAKIERAAADQFNAEVDDPAIEAEAVEARGISSLDSTLPRVPPLTA